MIKKTLPKRVNCRPKNRLRRVVPKGWVWAKANLQ
jgi:hypothetical protein